MPELRSGKIIVVDGPESTYGESTGLFAGSEIVSELISVDTSSVAREPIEDDAQRLDDGALSPILGVDYGVVSVPLVTHLQGLGTAAGPGVPAAGNAVTHLLGACFQTAPDSTTGDDVAVAGGGVPPHTTLAFTTVGAGLAIPANEIGICGVTIAGHGVVWRPYTWTNATKLVTLLFALPHAPADGADVYGTMRIPYTYRWTGGVEYSASARILGATVQQGVELNGILAGLKIPGVAPREVPKLEWTLSAADHARVVDTHEAPPRPRKTVLAGGEFLLAMYGDSTPDTVKGKFDIEVPSAWKWDEDGNNAHGVTGAIRDVGGVTLIITAPHDLTLPSSMSGMDYLEEWEDYRDAEQFHFLAVFGQSTPGRVMVFYLPRLQLAGYQEDQDLGGVQAIKLTLKNYADASVGFTGVAPVPAILGAQG